MAVAHGDIAGKNQVLSKGIVVLLAGSEEKIPRDLDQMIKAIKAQCEKKWRPVE